MRYLVCCLLLMSCGVQTIEKVKVQDAKTYTTKTGSDPIQIFYDNVETYTNQVLQEMQTCLPFDLVTDDLTVGIYHVGFSTAGSSAFDEPNHIGMRDDLLRYMSFYGHELARWVLYQTGNLELYDVCSDCSPSGWEQEPMKCLWNTAESFSLCYVPDTDPTDYPWCNN